MTLQFLHAEFFLWMALPVLALFYLWMTQKIPEFSVFAPKALEHLRAPAMTMGLKGRNGLFLAASMLLITAMAEPVAVDVNSSAPPRANILIALDISQQSPENFERSKATALSLISALKGENIGILAFDDTPYRIAPLSRDSMILAALVRGLSPDMMHTGRSDADALIEALNKAKHADDPLLLIPISSNSLNPIQRREGIYVIPAKGGEAVVSILKTVRAEQNSNRLFPHVPLFFYPLGLGMFLIGLALSSMSKRRSVPLAGIVLLLVLKPVSYNAGMLDFRVLNEAKASYERGEYARSAELFERYQKNHDSPQIRYNRANALYKSGDYAQARIWYERVYTTDPVLNERARYNLARTVEHLEQHGLKSDVPSPQREALEKRGEKRTKKFSGEKTTRLYRIL